MTWVNWSWRTVKSEYRFWRCGEVGQRGRGSEYAAWIAIPTLMRNATDRKYYRYVPNIL